MVNPYYVSNLGNIPNQDFAGAAASMGGNRISNPAGYATAATGAASMIGDWTGMANQSLGLDQGSGGYDPSYYNSVFSSSGQKVTGGEVLGGVGKGAAVGASVGSVIPVIGTAIGAVGGAIVGGVGTAFAGNSRYRRQTRERNRALDAVHSSQNQYNQTTQTQSDQQLTQAEYYRRLNSL